MQFEGVRSTSQVANNFMGTGRLPLAGPPDELFVLSAIFRPAPPPDADPGRPPPLDPLAVVLMLAFFSSPLL